MVKASQLIPILIVIFLDMLGFGMIIPVIRDFTEYLVIQSGYETTNYATFSGILMASYSLFQFIFAPILGRLSDIYGRKPILLISIGGNVISYFLWAISNNFIFFFISRIISGATGGNISVAQSYIADITSKEERGKYMGLVGAIFGIGFIIGPFFGGLMSVIDMSQYSSGMIKFNQFSAIGVGTMILSIINLVWVYAKLTETIKNGHLIKSTNSNHVIESNQKEVQKKPLYNIFMLKSIKHADLLLIFLVFFTMSLGFVHVEATLAWDLKDRFHLNAKNTGYYFAYMGIVMAIVQGGIYRWLVTKFNLVVLARLGTFILTIGLFAMPFAEPFIIAAVVTAFMAFGMGIGNPSIMTMTSVRSGEDEQGVNLGVLQSLGSLARIIGPGIATLAYDRIGTASPYIISSGLLLISFLLISSKKIK